MPLFLTGGRDPEIAALSLHAIDGNGRAFRVHVSLVTFNNFTDKIIQAAAGRKYSEGAFWEEGGVAVMHVTTEDCREAK